MHERAQLMQKPPSTRGMRRSLRRLFASLALASYALARSAAGEQSAGSSGWAPGVRAPTAFFYGPAPVPAELMAQYDRVVVEPDAIGVPPSGGAAELFAYVSVGEVSQSRSWWQRVPRHLYLGVNRGWGSEIVDVGNPEWGAFFIAEVIAPLYARGYRAFFFDTLDSYRLVSRSESELARHERGLVRIVLAVKKRWPSVKIVLNRGFESCRGSQMQSRASRQRVCFRAGTQRIRRTFRCRRPADSGCSRASKMRESGSQSRSP